MRHLLEFSQWEDGEDDRASKYTVKNWEKADRSEEYISDDDDEINDLDKELDFFNVEIEDENGNQHTIAVNFQIFIEFLQKEMPNLESYLSNIDLNSIDEIFNDLESLGIDFSEMLQKWVDENVTKETLDVQSEDEEGVGSFVDEEGNIYRDDEDEDDFGYDEDEDEDDSY